MELICEQVQRWHRHLRSNLCDMIDISNVALILCMRKTSFTHTPLSLPILALMTSCREDPGSRTLPQYLGCGDSDSPTKGSFAGMPQRPIGKRRLRVLRILQPRTGGTLRPTNRFKSHHCPKWSSLQACTLSPCYVARSACTTGSSRLPSFSSTIQSSLDNPLVAMVAKWI